MATITSLGIGSGVDLNSIVSQLVAVERKPLTQLQADASSIRTQMSSVGTLQGLFSKLQDAANAITSPTLWRSVQSASSDATSVAVTASNGAPVGSYQVSVQQLATSQSVVSAAALADSTQLAGEGTMTIEIGSWSAGGTQFTARAGGNPVSITITAGDTLATMRDKINAANAGVNASIVTDASGARLTLASSDSGSAFGFRVQTADADGNSTDAAGLSRFAYDPAAGTGAMLLTQAGGNAQATINGIQVTGSSNTFSGVLDGLTVTANRVTTAPVSVSVNRDNATIRKAITDFATAYSNVATSITEMTKYDPATKTGGPLQGDTVTVGLLSRLRGLINTPSGASTVFTRLSDIGLTIQRDGTMAVNDTRLDAAMGRLSDLRTALTATNTAQPADAGLVRRFATLASALTGADGAITNRTAGLQKLLASNQSDQDKVNARAEAMQARLVAQYSAMDTAASRLNGLSSYMTAQLAALTRNNSN